MQINILSATIHLLKNVTFYVVSMMSVEFGQEMYFYMKIFDFFLHLIIYIRGTKKEKAKETDGNYKLTISEDAKIRKQHSYEK